MISKKVLAELKTIYKQAEGVSEGERQWRFNTAFDILFNEVVKREK